jgi:hypothetical protein
MKLRSGKIIGKKELPEVLQKELRQELNDNIREFKELLVDNQDFAKKLIKFIVFVGIENRYEMSDMIRNNINSLDITMPLLGVSGSLLTLVNGYGGVFLRGNIKYQDFIDSGMCTKIQNEILDSFDISLTGNQVIQDDMDI